MGKGRAPNRLGAKKALALSDHSRLIVECAGIAEKGEQLVNQIRIAKTVARG